MSNGSSVRVGIVGTGEMGMPLVRRALDAGHQVAAFARRPDARDALTRHGVQVVDDLRALGTGRDIVVIYVYADSQVRDIALGGELLDAMEPGSVLMISTTGSPATARDVAQRAAQRGVAVVDAPGSGSPAQLASGTLTVFAGGEAADVERCRPLFDAYAAHVHHVGPVGTGQMVKLINNVLFGCQVELAVEACRLAASVGIDDAALVRTLATGSGQSFSLDLVGMSGSAAAVLARAGHFIHKDVLVARDVAEAMGLPLGSFTTLVDAVLDRTSVEPTSAG